MARLIVIADDDLSLMAFGLRVGSNQRGQLTLPEKGGRLNVE
jgi:hypothetical protein